MCDPSTSNLFLKYLKHINCWLFSVFYRRRNLSTVQSSLHNFWKSFITFPHPHWIHIRNVNVFADQNFVDTDFVKFSILSITQFICHCFYFEKIPPYFDIWFSNSFHQIFRLSYIIHVSLCVYKYIVLPLWDIFEQNNLNNAIGFGKYQNDKEECN